MAAINTRREPGATPEPIAGTRPSLSLQLDRLEAVNLTNSFLGLRLPVGA